MTGWLWLLFNKNLDAPSFLPKRIRLQVCSESPQVTPKAINMRILIFIRLICTQDAQPPCVLLLPPSGDTHTALTGPAQLQTAPVCSPGCCWASSGRGQEFLCTSLLESQYSSLSKGNRFPVYCDT